MNTKDFMHIKKTMSSILSLYKKCIQSDSNFFLVLLRGVFYKLFFNKTILVHQKVVLRGIKNIHAKNKIEIGISYVGFMNKADKTYLNIKGQLQIQGKYSIGRGCRIDIGKDALVTIGNGGYINANTNIIIMHRLAIGDNCAISWDCQFLDDDFHIITYEGKKSIDSSIIIGNHVWIGCGVKIYKGTVIPNGCVIASNSIVRGKFDIENSILAGNPAIVIKKSIEWK